MPKPRAEPITIGPTEPVKRPPLQPRNVERDSAVMLYVLNQADLFRHDDEVVSMIYYRGNIVFVMTESPSHKAVMGYELFLNARGTVGGRTGRNATFCLLCDYYKPATLSEGSNDPLVTMGGNDANL